MKIILTGRIPSKKNSKTIVCMGRVPRLLPSANHQKWHKETSLQLKGKNKIPPNSKITFTLYAPDLRKGDLSNKWESIADLLVDNGIIEDDNWFVLGDVRMVFGGVDKEFPRCEIDY